MVTLKMDKATFGLIIGLWNIFSTQLLPNVIHTDYVLTVIVTAGNLVIIWLATETGQSANGSTTTTIPPTPTPTPTPIPTPTPSPTPAPTPTPTPTTVTISLGVATGPNSGTITANNIISISGPNASVLSGSTVTLTAVPAIGYKFLYSMQTWQPGQNTANPITVTPTANQSYTAFFGPQ
jgi:hypothetical protein